MKHPHPIKYRGRLNRAGWKFMRAIGLPGRAVMTLPADCGLCVRLETSRSAVVVRVCGHGTTYLTAGFRSIRDGEAYAYAQLAALPKHAATSIRPA